MEKLVFATNNHHKLEEVRAKLHGSFEVVSLQEIGSFDDIPETADTLEGNAFLKAKYVFEKFGIDCFADDTGLEIDALNGAPGVNSAHYAGNERDAQKNMQKVLDLMQGKENRTACFRTVIVLLKNGTTTYFEGKVCGKIAKSPSGNGGFGYDPIFIPDGYSNSFAELSLEEKNNISHRALAVEKLVEYLRHESTKL